MKEIFTDIYNKVLKFFQQEKDEAENSKEIAQNRLKLVLMHDRAKLDAVTMEKMRLELIKVISKYVEIDEEALDLNLDGDGQAVALMVNIPVLRTKDPEEIEAAEQEEKSEEAEETEVETSEEDKDENAVESEDEAGEESEDSSDDEVSDSDESEEDDENEEEVSEEDNIEESDEEKTEEDLENALESEVEEAPKKNSKGKNK